MGRPSHNLDTAPGPRHRLTTRRATRKVTAIGPCSSTAFRTPHQLADEAERELLDFLSTKPEGDSGEPATRALVKKMVPGAAMDGARNGLTRLMRPLAHRSITRAQGRRSLRLHLGSGFEYKRGWVNVDRAPIRVDVPWNLGDGVPFANGSVDAVFHEHLMEHLTLQQGHALLRETHRVLRPGGTLRAGVPDAGALLCSYAGTWESEWAQSAVTPMIAVQRLFYEHGHRAMYDGQTMSLMFRAAGFSDVGRRAFGQSRINPCPDTPARAAGTLYVEGVRPH